LQFGQFLILVALNFPGDIDSRSLRGAFFLLAGCGCGAVGVFLELLTVFGNGRTGCGRWPNSLPSPRVTCRKNRYRKVSSSMRSIRPWNSS